MRWRRWGEQPLRPRAFVVVVAAALGVLVLAFELAVRPVDSIGGSDVTVYEPYGAEVLGGAMPYRDFRLEYPPGALPMFVLPATRAVAGGSTEGASWMPPNAPARRYYHGFTLLVLVLLGAIVVSTAVTLRTMGRPARTVALSLLVVASSPLLIGQTLTERFDVWPAALTATALATSVRGHYRLGGAMLGLGATVKLYPALLLPALAIVVIRQRGAREATAVVGISVAAVAAVFLPFAIASFSGTWESLDSQFESGLQVESLASSVVVMASHVAEWLPGLALPPPSDFKAEGAGGGLIRIDLHGPGVGTTETVMTVLLAAVLCLVWVGLARSRRDPREDLLRYTAATVATVLALGTVLSPQYVVWLIPLVTLVSGRRGAAATLFFVLAAVLTNLWFPDQFLEYQGGLDAGPTSLLLARNLALLAIALVLVLPAGPSSARARVDAE